jgi:hypothetical protein
VAQYALKALLAHSSDTPAYVFVNSDGRLCVRDEAGHERLVAPITNTTVVRPSIDGEPTAPTLVAHGVSLHWHCKVGDLAYAEFSFAQYRDETQDVELRVAWAPSDAEADKTVAWQIDVAPVIEGDSNTDATWTDTITVAMAPVANAHTTSSVFVPAAICAGKDELYVRVTRVASGADSVADVGLSHIAMVEILA